MIIRKCLTILLNFENYMIMLLSHQMKQKYCIYVYFTNIFFIENEVINKYTSVLKNHEIKIKNPSMYLNRSMLDFLIIQNKVKNYSEKYTRNMHEVPFTS